jgi:hypothetical protein
MNTKWVNQKRKNKKMKKLVIVFGSALLVFTSCSTSSTNTAEVIPSQPAPVVIPKEAPKPGSGEESQKRSKTKIKFKKMVHDFGRMKEGEKREFDFEFTNTGKEDLIIEDCKGSCGCTVPEWPKDPIKPGQSAAINVKFDSTKKEKDQEKSVTITANTEPEITTVIKIKAYVEPSAAK